MRPTPLAALLTGFVLALGLVACGGSKVGVQPMMMTQKEFAAYFKADVLDTENLAKAAGIEKQ